MIAKAGETRGSRTALFHVATLHDYIESTKKQQAIRVVGLGMHVGEVDSVYPLPTFWEFKFQPTDSGRLFLGGAHTTLATWTSPQGRQ